MLRIVCSVDIIRTDIGFRRKTSISTVAIVAVVQRLPANHVGPAKTIDDKGMFR